MILLNSIDDKYFELNGVNYARIYQPLIQGADSVSIVNVYDTRQKIINSTSYDEFLVNGLAYGSQILLIAALLEVVYSPSIVQSIVTEVFGEGGGIIAPTFEDSGNGMHIMVSRNGERFNDLFPVAGGVYQSSTGTLRDPSLNIFKGVYYIVYTDDWQGSTFAIATSKNLTEWEHLVTVDLGASWYRTWAPELYVENDIAYIILTKTEIGGDNARQMYIMNSTDMVNWSTPVQLQGFPSNVIDGFPYKESGKYYMFYKNETTKYIEVAESSSIGGVYVQIRTGDWAGWGSGFEGASVIRREDGGVRIFMDRFSLGGYFYADADSVLGVWSGLAEIETDTELRHFTPMNLSASDLLNCGGTFRKEFETINFRNVNRIGLIDEDAQLIISANPTNEQADSSRLVFHGKNRASNAGHLYMTTGKVDDSEIHFEVEDLAGVITEIITAKKNGVRLKGRINLDNVLGESTGIVGSVSDVLKIITKDAELDTDDHESRIVIHGENAASNAGHLYMTTGGVDDSEIHFEVENLAQEIREVLRLKHKGLLMRGRATIEKTYGEDIGLIGTTAKQFIAISRDGELDTARSDSRLVLHGKTNDSLPGHIFLSADSDIDLTAVHIEVGSGGSNYESAVFSKNGILLKNASVIPSSNPSGGGYMYAEGGALKWRGSSGTVTTIAPA